MKKTLEILFSDLKKLTKEMELTYGDIKPQICSVENPLESCPNKNCWVNRSRDDFFNELCICSEAIVNSLDILNNQKINEETIQNVKKILNAALPKHETEPSKIAISF
jgi:hypothetical protein